jgi:conjugal transfer mating pair stabilization protein TraG
VQTHENLGQWELAATTEQAAQQRNAQWAAEQTLFTRIVRPMMTFFEGLIFAITPLMAFTIALGPAGIAMTGKYLLFGLWIQLWMPIMAIINLYLHMTIAGDLDALQNTRATSRCPRSSRSTSWTSCCRTTSPPAGCWPRAPRPSA